MRSVTGSLQELEKAYCAACGSMVSRGFRPGPDGRPEASCPRCGSLERHRFLSLLLGVLAPQLRDLGTVVEIGPSRQSTALLERLGARRLIGLDLGYDSRDVDALACLTRLPLRDGSVDLLVCYHVLEHVVDDLTSIEEIARVLSPSGVAIIEVPVKPGETDEDVNAPVEERIRRFGQADHLRYYGVEDFERRLNEHGLRFQRLVIEDVVDPWMLETLRLTPQERIWLCTRIDCEEPEFVRNVPHRWSEALESLVDSVAMNARRSGARVERLEAKVERLEARAARLDARNKKLKQRVQTLRTNRQGQRGSRLRAIAARRSRGRSAEL